MGGRDELKSLCCKRKNVTATRETVPWIIWALEIFVIVNVIKFIYISHEPKTDKYHIELQSLYHIIDVNKANFAGVNYITNIYRNAH